MRLPKIPPDQNIRMTEIGCLYEYDFSFKKLTKRFFPLIQITHSYLKPNHNTSQKFN